MKAKPFNIKMLILAGLVAAATGCTSYMKFKYGMKEPRKETPESLVLFLEKNKFPRGDIYIFTDSSSYFQALRNTLFRKNLLSHMIFDRNGLYLPGDTAQCQWWGYEMIRALNPDTTYRSQPGLQLDHILDHIMPVGRNPVSQGPAEKPEFTLIVTWAKFLGRYNYRLFDLEGAVHENRAAKIRVIWLNVDLQKSWNLTRDQKISIR